MTHSLPLKAQHVGLPVNLQEKFGQEIEALRSRIMAKVGEDDLNYIRKILLATRLSEFTGRGLLLAGAFLPTPWLVGFWIAGVLLLAISKIINNMELGHNVMHGQFNWTGDPRFDGKKFEWDIVGTSHNWRWTHNYRHHAYTNVHGADDDIGYGMLRIFPEQAWKPAQLLQPLYALILALFFQWGVALQALRMDRLFSGEVGTRNFLAEFKPVGRKIGKQLLKDYLLFPAMAGPGFGVVFLGNLVANGLRNIWTYVVIFCGHFTSHVQTFPMSVLRQETRAQWYERQIRGSSNISGGAIMDMMSGNLSHQIEHHLFPDVPANRYAEMAPQVRDICKRYGLPYHTGSMPKQFTQVLWRIFRHAFPSRPVALKKLGMHHMK